jgi:hypothetical protein
MMPKTDIEDPKRRKLLNEIADPTEMKSRTDKDDPKRGSP